MITARRLPFDPLLAAMAAGLALAVGAMAYPAFRGNPWSAPGMILILTAGLIALVGLFGFRRAEAGRPASDVAVDRAREMTRLLRRILELPLPVIGAIDGNVRAGGLGIVGAHQRQRDALELRLAAAHAVRQPQLGAPDAQAGVHHLVGGR